MPPPTPPIVNDGRMIAGNLISSMAAGVSTRLGADWGVATTGVAGPDLQEGKPAGRVHVAVGGPAGAVSRRLQLPGDRRAVREETVTAVLRLLAETLGVVSPEVEGEVEQRE